MAGNKPSPPVRPPHMRTRHSGRQRCPPPALYAAWSSGSGPGWAIRCLTCLPSGRCNLPSFGPCSRFFCARFSSSSSHAKSYCIPAGNIARHVPRWNILIESIERFTAVFSLHTSCRALKPVYHQTIWHTVQCPATLFRRRMPGYRAEE